MSNIIQISCTKTCRAGKSSNVECLMCLDEPENALVMEGVLCFFVSALFHSMLRCPCEFLSSHCRENPLLVVAFVLARSCHDNSGNVVKWPLAVMSAKIFFRTESPHQNFVSITELDSLITATLFSSCPQKFNRDESPVPNQVVLQLPPTSLPPRNCPISCQKHRVLQGQLSPQLSRQACPRK